LPVVLQSAFGLIALLAIAWLMSENRRAVPWRIVVSGVILQLLLVALLLKAPPVRHFFLALNELLLTLERATQAGTAFVFGYLGGAPLPYAESHARASFVLAFRALPLILVVSALSARKAHRPRVS
jgi:CNT family concentrative nucleoside transporter